jgi:hypothetical protein
MNMSWRREAGADLALAHWMGQASGCTLRLIFSFARLDLIRLATICSFAFPRAYVRLRLSGFFPGPYPALWSSCADFAGS